MHRPARVVDVAVRAHEQRRLPLGVALAHDLVQPRYVLGLVARAGQQAVRRDDLLDRADELRPAGGEDDEVVADALEVGDDVGREDDRQLALGDGFDDGLHELAPRERIERGDRLVEEEQLGRFASASVSATCARCPPERLRTFFFSGSPRLGDAIAGRVVVPAGIELAADAEHLLDA